MTDPTARLEFTDLERVYTLLAEAIDTVGPERETLFLAKLALTLARQVGDHDAVAETIATARLDLD
jgi:hypothetical protein